MWVNRTLSAATPALSLAISSNRESVAAWPALSSAKADWSLVTSLDASSALDARVMAKKQDVTE